VSSPADLLTNLQRAIVGQEAPLRLIIASLLAGGHILLDDVPGVGKTLLAKALARSIAGDFKRVQFSADLMPSDITGSNIFNPQGGVFRFAPGPVFAHVLLADEINRASPRTQSALLEAMGECQATIEGERYDLPAPFLVVATENPVEFHGTYPLPEAQLDRFLLTLKIGYPDQQTEKDILYAQAETNPLDSIGPVVGAEEVLEMQRMVRHVKVEDGVARYIVEIVDKTRHDTRLKIGSSPRGTLMFFRASQAAAFSRGRDYVLPDDVQRLAPHVLPHRLILTSKAKYGGTTKEEVVADVIRQVKVPT